MDAFLIAFLSIIFLSIGSLTSVLIHRLILMEFQKTDINLFFPPSHCINCEAKISLINLIPILGYVLQRGRCIKCNASISITYLIPVSYTHLRAHETGRNLVCRLLLEKKKRKKKKKKLTSIHHSDNTPQSIFSTIYISPHIYY